MYIAADFRSRRFQWAEDNNYIELTIKQTKQKEEVDCVYDDSIFVVMTEATVSLYLYYIMFLCI